MRTGIIVILLFLSAGLSAQVVPPSFQSDWHKAGFEDSFVEPTQVIDVTTFGAIANDGLPDDAALVTALSTVVGATTIYFPAGQFNFNQSISLHDSIVIKGAGADSTEFIFDLNNAQLNCINFQGSGSAPFHALYDGLSNGSAHVLCDGADTLYFPEDYIEIRQLNGSWDTNPAFWAEYSVGHLSKVAAVIGDTIYLKDALRIDLDTSLQAEIHKIVPIKNAGIECFRISRTDSLAAGINYGVYLYYAWNCRIKGIESFKSIGAHIIAEITAHCVIRDSYFHDAYTFDGSNTRGYGVVMAVHSCLNKIENCIFRRLRHAMMIKQGANGNVFGYNYSFETLRTEFPSNAGGDISVHGHYPFANLFEGNVCQNLLIDQAWGPAGPRNLYFRNRAELYGLIMSSGTVQSDTQAFVGNTFPSTAAFTGLYLLAGSGHFEYGNSVQGTIQPPGTSLLPDSSYYLDSVPVFMPVAAGFPSIGTGGSGGETNGAEQRFIAGNPPAYCSENIVSVSEPKTENEYLQVYYSGGEINILSISEKKENLILSDVSGRIISVLKPPYQDGIIKIPISLQPGIYFVRFFPSSLSASFVVN